MTVMFGTKAETLDHLSSQITTAKVLPQVRLCVSEWDSEPSTIIERIQQLKWLDIPLIVRSSAVDEDNENQSMAGQYQSVPNVIGEEQLRKAICQVRESYNRNNGDDQIFIQPMLQDVIMSGVAFSKDPNTGGSYIVINYDDTTGSTYSVTSGESSDHKTYYYYKFANVTVPDRLQRVITMIRELEDMMSTNALDIEFAITSNEQLYLLQVRPLVINVEPNVTEEEHYHVLRAISTKVKGANTPHPYLYGTRTVFGVMPDWNPAEIIGIRPRPLALSLYKEIITDNIWAYQRDNYGYKNLRSFPLLMNFHGLPYIDARVSFNSFIPAEVEPDLSERLVNYYIDRLIETPSYHDKVEFKIIYSCYTLDLPERLQVLRNHGFSQYDCESLSKSLRNLTNRIINGETGLWRQDADKIKKLEARRNEIVGSQLDKISKIYWLLEDCKRYGTLPFAGLARAGFIAVQLLKSLVNVGILNEKEYQTFMGTLDTVSSNMVNDFESLSKKAFLEKYGHLRPGTYDILSPRYDEEPDRYFNWSEQLGGSVNHERFLLSLTQFRQTEAILKEHCLDHNVLGLFEFIKGAIEGREYAKFVFTRSLSDAMALFKSVALEYGFSEEDCSFADISVISRIYSSSMDIASIIGQSIEEGKKNHKLTRLISLPPLITNNDDVWAFELPQFEPNYITLKGVVGDVASGNLEKGNLTGKVIMIPSADPGYDWIFSQGISGFITMYGGVNSHMAIRAGELGIPAVIGSGEVLYNKWQTAKVIEIDCLHKQVRVIR